MNSRYERLAALNGESRVFKCAGCGQIHRVEKAVARVARTANLVCVYCIARAHWDLLCNQQAEAVLTGTVILPGKIRKTNIEVNFKFEG